LRLLAEVSVGIVFKLKGFLVTVKMNGKNWVD
jgi:hypothetical protein